MAYVLVKMANSPRPGVWILERSVDYGKTFTTWQYFASSRDECQAFFPQAELTITRDDSVVCDTSFSDIIPLENGEVNALSTRWSKFVQCLSLDRGSTACFSAKFGKL